MGVGSLNLEISYATPDLWEVTSTGAETQHPAPRSTLLGRGPKRMDKESYRNLKSCLFRLNMIFKSKVCGSSIFVGSSWVQQSNWKSQKNAADSRLLDIPSSDPTITLQRCSGEEEATVAKCRYCNELLVRNEKSSQTVYVAYICLHEVKELNVIESAQQKSLPHDIVWILNYSHT